MKPALLCLSLLALVTVSSAQSPILTWNLTPGVSAVIAVGPGDLNGDGIPDIVISVLSSGGCVTARSGLNGDVVIWQTCVGAAGTLAGPSLAIAGDLDGDLRAEIVIAAPAGATTVLSGATGAIVRTIPFGSLAVDGGRDFNGDGTPDQLGTFSIGSGPGQVGARVFSGTNGAVLATVTSGGCACGSSITAIFLPDLNGDGLAEVALGFPAYGGILQNGAVEVRSGPLGAPYGSIASPGGLFFFGKTLVDAGDLTGDGRSELGVSGDYGGASLRIYDVVSGGNILPSAFLWSFNPTSPGMLTQIANADSIGDLDGDGLPDLAVSVSFYAGPISNGSIQPHLVSGANGSILAAPLYGPTAANNTPGFVASIGDLQGDGLPEFIHAYSGFLGFPVSYLVASVRILSGLAPLATGGTSLGGSCAGYPIGLASTGLVRIAQPWQLTLQGAPAASADLVIDPGLPVTQLHGTCTWHPDLSHLAAWYVFPLSAAGGTAWITLQVPAMPTLAGVPVTTQAVVYGVPPYGFDVSNGLSFTIGF